MTRRSSAAAAGERARRASLDRRSVERSRRRLALRRYLEHHPHRVYWQVAIVVVVGVPAVVAVALALR